MDNNLDSLDRELAKIEAELNRGRVDPDVIAQVIGEIALHKYAMCFTTVAMSTPKGKTVGNRRAQRENLSAQHPHH